MGILADPDLDRLLMGSPLRRPGVARRVIAGLALALFLSLAVIVLVVFSMSAAATRIFLGGVLLSALFSVVPVVVLRFLDRRGHESPWLFAIAILWGALIATGLALPLNTWIIGAVAQWLEQHREVADYLGPQGALLVGAPLAASEPGPPPQVSFVDAWVQTSLQNLIVPFVLVMLVVLWRSGRQERRLITEEPADEVGGAVTAEEYAAIRRDRLLRTRRVDRCDRRRSAALVNAQHELAFRKRAVRREGGDPDADPLVAGWRREIEVLRA